MKNMYCKHSKADFDNNFYLAYELNEIINYVKWGWGITKKIE